MSCDAASRWVVAVVAVVASLLAPLPAAAAKAADPSAQLVAGLVGWPAETDAVLDARHRALESCLAARIRELAPQVRLLTQREVRNLLFPLLEPATQPATEDAFAALVKRADVRARLAQAGLRYLVTFSGATTFERPGGSVLCGGGYGGIGCLGFVWRGESTALGAALWSLDNATVLAHEESTAKGSSVMPAIGLPLPIAARTQAAACEDLATRLALAMRRAAGR